MPLLPSSLPASIAIRPSDAPRAAELRVIKAKVAADLIAKIAEAEGLARSVGESSRAFQSRCLALYHVRLVREELVATRRVVPPIVLSGYVE